MKISVTVAANTTVQLGTVDRRRDHYIWQATMFAYGTWGSGSLAWQWSPDGGTTKLAINDASRSAITSVANDSFQAQGGTGSHNSDKVTIYATLTGATNPSLTVGFFDNN